MQNNMDHNDLYESPKLGSNENKNGQKDNQKNDEKEIKNEYPKR
jgi:hypothetical protein